MKDDYQYLLGLLKKVNESFELTTRFDYKLNKRNKTLTLTVRKDGLVSNMQDDSAAFESWAIILKYYLPKEIDTIEIEWEKTFSKGEDGYLHYNRFIYRLAKFIQTYEWAIAAKPIPAIPALLFCNVANGNAAAIDEHKTGSEGWLECKYVEDHYAEFDVMDHQLPVGIFDWKVSKSTHFTTGQKSAIDIWSIKDNEFSLFELKLPTNKPLGIISEILFYTNVVDDIFCHQVMFENSSSVREAVAKSYRSFDKIYAAYKNGSIQKIHSIMLADNLHPMITNGLLEFINNSPRWRHKNISYEWQKVSK